MGYRRYRVEGARSITTKISQSLEGLTAKRVSNITQLNPIKIAEENNPKIFLTVLKVILYLPLAGLLVYLFYLVATTVLAYVIASR